MMKTFLAFSLTVISLLIFNSCDTAEPIADEITPGRRDYTWTVDTLDHPVSKIGGSSPTDVWVTSLGDWDKSISHFDGTIWSSYGINGIVVPYAIYAFDANNIFIGAENGKIWRYDGNGWEMFANVTINESSQIAFYGFWGESPNNFYAFGAYPDQYGIYNNSVIIKINSNTWEALNSDSLHGAVQAIFKNSLDDNIYLRTIEWNTGSTYDTISIYSYSNNIFNRLYKGTWDYNQACNINLINNEVYFVLGRKIAKRINNEFETIIDLSSMNFSNTLWGRTSQDIFLSMTDGLAHFNGNDVEYLFNFNKSSTQIYGIALFDKEIFVLVYEYPIYLIYHGKLN